MGEEIGDFRFSHVHRMPLIVEKNKSANPIYVSLLGSDAEMLAPDNVAHAIKEFWFVARYGFGYAGGRVRHSPQPGPGSQAN